MGGGGGGQDLRKSVPQSPGTENLSMSMVVHSASRSLRVSPRDARLGGATRLGLCSALSGHARGEAGARVHVHARVPSAAGRRCGLPRWHAAHLEADLPPPIAARYSNFHGVWETMTPRL